MALLGEILVRFNSETAGFVSGVGLATAAIVGIGAVIGETVKMASDFQAGITNLATAAGESSTNLGMVGDGIKKVATDTGTSTKDLIDAMFMIESSGAHGSAGLNELSIAARGARTDNADLMTVSKALTGVLAGWPQTANGAAGAMNELIVAASEGKMHLQDLSKAMGNVIPIATNAGVSFADVSAAVAMMTNKNMTAQRASQGIAFALRDLSAPSGIAQKAMASVGLSAQDLRDTLSTKGLGATLQEITDAVGNTFPKGSIEATTALKNIMGGAAGLNVALSLGGKNLATYEANVKKVADAAKNGGQAVEGWSTVQGNFNTKVNQAKASMEVLGITLGTELLPLLGSILDKVTPIITNFVDWETKTHTVQNAIKSLADGIGNMITTGAGIVKFFQDNQVAGSALEGVLVVLAGVGIMLMIQALVGFAVAVVAATIPMLPMIATIALIALAVTGIILLIKNWGAIMDWLSGKTKQATLEQGQSQEKARIKAITESELQKTGVLKNLEEERKQLAEKIKGMADNSDKSRAQIRLTALDNQIRTTKGNITELDKEKAAHLKTLKDLESQDPQIREKTKIAAIQKQIDEKDGVLKHLEDEKTKLVGKITDEKDGSDKQRDLMKLDAINKQIDTTDGTLKALTNEATGHKTKLADMKSADLEARKNWYDRANDATTTWMQSWNGILKVGYDNANNATTTWFNNMNDATNKGYGQVDDNIGTGVRNFLTTIKNGYDTANNATTVWVNNVTATIESLPGRAASALGTFVNSIWTSMTTAATDAFNGGVNIVMGVANGIYSAIGNAVAASQSLAAQVAAFLPRSPAKQGPLKDLNLFGPSLVQGFASGIDKSHPIIKASMEHLLTPIDGRAMSVSGTGQSPSGSNGQGSNGTQTIILQIDGREMAKALGPHLTNEIRLVAQVRR